MADRTYRVVDGVTLKRLRDMGDGSWAEVVAAEGTAADGAAAVGKPVQVGGKDGSGNIQTVLVHTTGALTVVNPDGTNVGSGGAGGGTSSQDEAAFVDGTTLGTPMAGAYFDQVNPSLVSAIDRIGVVGIDERRNVYVRESWRDLAARTYENIIDLIGAENVRLFLPMWELSGTVLRDLLNRDLTFTASGLTLAQSGPVHHVPAFDGSLSYAEQRATTRNDAGVNETALTGTTDRLAQKVVVHTGQPGFVRLKIKRVGAATTWTVRAAIYNSSGADPGSAISNGTAVAMAATNIGTSFGEYGFVFSTPPSMTKNSTYWVVLDYSDSTGVDGSNHVAWAYDAAGGYGQGRAAYDGAAWTLVPGNDYVFGLWAATCCLMTTGRSSSRRSTLGARWRTGISSLRAAW